MRYHHAILAVSLLFMTACNAGQVTLDTKESKESYSVGHSIGTTLKVQKLSVNANLVAAGLKDALTGKGELTTENMQQILITFQEEQIKKQQEGIAVLAEKNQSDGAAYLAANKNKAGVVTLKSGLQYKVLSKGSGGTSPKESNTVSVHYKGTLIDGTVFDSSYARNEPASFKLNQVIPGWTEGLQYMKVGDLWEFTIPAELAYGQSGAGALIGPNTTLVFEVKLLEIK